MTHIAAPLRRLVRDRARGACEYCLLPESLSFALHEVDHVIAQKHGGATEESNLALCCVACNLRKGSDIASIDPGSGALAALFHPRRERWRDHFELEGAVIVARTATGRATVRLLGMNAAARVRERALALQAGMLRVPG